MARKQIETVWLERQPHRESVKRLQLAYQLLIESAKQVSAVEEIMEETNLQPQEVEKCQ